MSRAIDDEEASLAFARNLQAQYDQTAFASFSQEESPIEAEYRAAARLRAKHGSLGGVASSTGWKSGMNDGENSQRRKAEVEVNTSPMSNEDLARQIQMHDQFHFPFVNYSDPSATSFSLSTDSKGKHPSFVPFTPGVFTGPPSPPVSPLQYQSPSSQNPPPYSFHTSGIPQPPLLLPPSPQEEAPVGPVTAVNGSDHSAINGSINFATQLPQSSRTHSPTVVPYQTMLTCRTMTNYWQDYYKRNMEGSIPVYTPPMRNLPRNYKRNLTKKMPYTTLILHLIHSTGIRRKCRIFNWYYLEKALL